MKTMTEYLSSCDLLESLTPNELQVLRERFGLAGKTVGKTVGKTEAPADCKPPEGSDDNNSGGAPAAPGPLS